jgi:agmatine deiminase
MTRKTATGAPLTRRGALTGLLAATALPAWAHAAPVMAAAGEQSMSKRVPAEWEPQAAIWLQWPGPNEKAHETAFARMATVIVAYERLHILHYSTKIRDDARAAITGVGGDPDHANMVWHQIANDSAWMRDNGPVYVVGGGEMRVQNWAFNAWGGAFGATVPYRYDNRVPAKVGAYLDLPVDDIDIVHERGNLEFNGVDTVILNWSTLGDPARNPGYTRDQADADLQQHFGVSKVVFVEGVPEGDRTKGHIDGIARFIDPTTVVVPVCTANSICRPGGGGNDAVFDGAAATIEAAGFTVIRDPIEGVAPYQGYRFDTNYMNWLVGNGFVIAVGFGVPDLDAAAKSRIEGYFPGRDVHVIEMLSSWAAGGGVHCHTNDQPAVSTINAGDASKA